MANVTKKDMFNEIITLATANEREDIVEFAEKEIALLAKRNSKSDKVLAKRETEKRELENQVLEVLFESTEPLRTMEIANLMGVSPQKATPVLKRLVESEKIDVAKVKGVNVYSIPTGATEEAEVDDENEIENVDTKEAEVA